MLLKEHNYIVAQSMEEFTPQVLQRVIQAHKSHQVPRLKKLYNYYVGKNQEILKRTFADATKPNNKITNNFSKLITEQITSMFIANPVKYTSEDKEALLELQIVNEINQEKHHNFILAKNASIYGTSFEVLYMDEQAEIRYAVLPTEEVIPVYTSGLGHDTLVGAIRYYTIESLSDTTDDLDVVEVYDAYTVKTYNATGGAMKLVNEVPHYFRQVPINVYQANDDQLGDSEGVLALIDAYDSALSNTANTFDYFSDAYLVLTNAMDSNPEEFAQMSQDRILLLPENGNAEFLAKQIDSASLDSYMNKLKENIFKFSYIVDLENSSFGNDVSGVALRYRLQMLESVCSSRERLFSQAITKRNQMIFNILAVKGKLYDANAINLTFTRNIPASLAEEATVAQQLTGIVSKETILEMLSCVEDVQGELERMNNEQMGMEALVNPYPEPDVEDDDDLEEIPPME